MNDLILRPWQPPMIEFGLEKPRCQLLARMGMGKSAVTLSITAELLRRREVKKVLIVAPLRVARSTWPEEAARWSQFAHLRISTVIGDSEQRKAALRAEADIYGINFENVPWAVEHLGDKWPFDMVVCDESTKIKSFRLQQGGKRAQSLAAWAHKKVKRWVNLSGTFNPNGLVDIWGPMWFIDEGTRLGRSFSAFEQRWFGYQRASDAVNAHKTRIARIAFPHAQREITDLIKDVSLAVHPKDWFDIKDPIVVRRYVTLPPAARKTYREMELAMFTHIKGYDIEAFASSGKVIKCMQLAAGCCYTGSDAEIEGDISHWVPVHDEKLEELDSIITECQGEPVLVVYHFKPDLARLKKRFPQGRHINTKADEDAFKRGEIDIAFVHPASIGHGVDGFQKVCRTIIFFSINWDLDPHDQIIERIGPMRQMQAGLDREVMVYLILAKGTVDETVDARLVKKRGVQESTFDLLALKPAIEEEQLW